MIRIVATFHVRPDAVEEFRALAGELVKGSRAEEGSIAYDLCVARDDATSFVRRGATTRQSMPTTPRSTSRAWFPSWWTCPPSRPRWSSTSRPEHEAAGDRRPHQSQAVMRHRETPPSESTSSRPSVGTCVRGASQRSGAAPVAEPEAVASELL